MTLIDQTDFETVRLTGNGGREPWLLRLHPDTARAVLCIRQIELSLSLLVGNLRENNDMDPESKFDFFNTLYHRFLEKDFALLRVSTGCMAKNIQNLCDLLICFFSKLKEQGLAEDFGKLVFDGFSTVMLLRQLIDDAATNGNGGTFFYRGSSNISTENFEACRQFFGPAVSFPDPSTLIAATQVVIKNLVVSDQQNGIGDNGATRARKHQ